MANGLVSDFFDIAALNAQKAEAEKIVNAYFETVNNGNKSSGINGQGQALEIAELAKQVKILTDANLKLNEVKVAEISFSKEMSTNRSLEKAGAKEALAIEKEIAKSKEDLRKIEKAGTLEKLQLDKEVAAIVAKNAKDASDAQRQATKDAKEDDRNQKIAAKNTFDLANAYDVLNAKHKLATKEYQNAAAAGKLSAEQLVIMKDKANLLGEQLSKIDQATGNYRRNVGNYSSAWNGLGNAINQVGRELPNFAQSAQLGFLAISNNLPILFDEIKRAKETIEDLKREGEDAPSVLSQISKAIFSWQTVMVLLIGVSVKYGGVLWDWIAGVNEAEKSIMRYQKALGDNIKSESESIGKLIQAKQALNDTNVSRQTQNDLLIEAKKIAPEHLQFLSIEENSLAFINARLDEQIAARIELAKASAAQTVVTENTTALMQAQIGLNEKLGVGEKLWARISAAYTVDINTMTESAKKLVEVESDRYKRGEITLNQYEAKAIRIQKLSDAEKNLTSSIEDSISPINMQVKGLEENIKVLAKKKAFEEESIASYGDIQGLHRAELASINNETAALTLQIAALKSVQSEKQKNAFKNMNIDKGDETELLRLENNARETKKDSKERTEAVTLAAQKRKEIAIKAKNDEYKIDRESKLGMLANNAKYREDMRKIDRDYDDEIAREDKKTKPKKEKKKKEDTSNVGTDIFTQIQNEVELAGGAIKMATSDALDAQLAMLDKGLISIEEYQRNKKEIIKKSEEDILAAQIVVLERVLDEIGLSEENKQKVIQLYYNKSIALDQAKTASVEAEVMNRNKVRQTEEDAIAAAIYKQINEEEKAANAREARIKGENELRRQIAQETAAFIFTLIDAQSQKEIAALNKKKERVSEEYNTQIEAVDKAFLNDDEKAAQKKVLLAEEKRDQDQIDQEIREKKKRAAIIDKAAALAQIAINTAIAITSIARTGGGTNYADFGVSAATLAALTLGLGAAQAAVVAAQPIPEYAKGKSKNDPYTGKAIAGEAGTELRIGKDGSLDLFTKPTLIDTKYGDTILSNKQMKQGEAFPFLKQAGLIQDNAEMKTFFAQQFTKQNRILKNAEPVIIDNSKYYERRQNARM